MALGGSLAALAFSLLALFTGGPNLGELSRSLLELAAVVGAFTLICAAEASN